MKSKQEVIQEAWLEFMSTSDYAELKIDDNGFCNYQCRRYINSTRWDKLYSRIKSGGKSGRDIIYRPKSLSGIENNNGWTRIESEDDLPKKLGEYHIINRWGNRSRFVVRCLKTLVDDWNRDKFTHWHPVIEPKPHIY